ncbi:hypothetical protein [Streptomyces sp. NPDC012510]|uniref:hypothetical protein n=1 Tax=Streptomyces sp. NPDC012510 TaxID=3364838 RepID=UPI0036F06D31
MSYAARTSPRTLAALTLLSTAVLLSTTACSSSGDAGVDERPVRAAEPSPAKAKATPAADSDEAEVAANAAKVTVGRAPKLTMGDEVVLRQDASRGNASLEFGKAEKDDGKTLTIEVECEGKGRIEVVLRPLGASFPMDCVDGEVTGITNQFTAEGAARAGTVSVTALSNVHWSLSVGRGEPTEQNLDG